MSATTVRQPVNAWQCDLCGSRKPPETKRLVTFGNIQFLGVACQRCGYPALAEIIGGESA